MGEFVSSVFYFVIKTSIPMVCIGVKETDVCVWVNPDW